MKESSLKPKLKRYLSETLGITLEPSRKAIPAVPFYLQGRYEFWLATLNGADCLFFTPSDSYEAWGALNVVRDREQLASLTDLNTVFIAERITSGRRRQLMSQKTPFIIPGSQLYLPDLHLDLREHFIKARERPSYLSPSSQRILLYMIQSGYVEMGSGAILARELKISRMTSSRAMEELEYFNLAEIMDEGRTKRIRISRDFEMLWKNAQKSLRSPVKKKIFVCDEDQGLYTGLMTGGLTALAKHSNLLAPERPVFAYNRPPGDPTKKILGWNETSDPSEADFEGEFWSYPPISVRNNVNDVDKLSLYLSLKDDEDERVQQALSEMMKGIKW